MEQDSKKVKEEVKTGPEAYLEEFQRCLANATALTTQMTTRQLSRVFRSVLKAPFEKAERFVDPKEQVLYSLGVRVMDIKMLIVTEQMKQLNQPIDEVTKEAKKLEEEGTK